MAVAVHTGRFCLHPETDSATLAIFGVEPPEPVAALLLTVELRTGEVEVAVAFRGRRRGDSVTAWRVACPDLFEVATDERWVARTWRLKQVVAVVLTLPADVKGTAEGRYCLSVPAPSSSRKWRLL